MNTKKKIFVITISTVIALGGFISVFAASRSLMTTPYQFQLGQQPMQPQSLIRQGSTMGQSIMPGQQLRSVVSPIVVTPVPNLVGSGIDCCELLGGGWQTSNRTSQTNTSRRPLCQPHTSWGSLDVGTPCCVNNSRKFPGTGDWWVAEMPSACSCRTYSFYHQINTWGK